MIGSARPGASQFFRVEGLQSPLSRWSMALGSNKIPI